MSQLDQLIDRLRQDRRITLTHPLDPTITMVHRPPTPTERDTAMAAVDAHAARELVPAYAGLLADTLVEIRGPEGPVADIYGKDLATELGIEWTTDTRATDIVLAFYGGERGCWDRLVGHGKQVHGLASGRGADPLG